MTADCAAVSCDAKRQPAAIDSGAIVLLNPCARALDVPQSFFSYSIARRGSATCCGKLLSAFSNHPHPRPPEATPAVGGSGVNPFLSVGSYLARCAHVAH